MKQKLFTGAITALVTPFTRKGDVDILALERLVEFQIKNGINALVPCGSTGEAATLNDEEYELVVRTVVKTTKKRIPVIVGAGSNNTEHAVKLSTIAKQSGADGLLHVTPYYNKPTPAGLVAHFKAISSVDLPIILYNIPGRTGSNVSSSTVLDIAKKVPQLVGVKEASGNIIQMMNIIKDAPEEFSILSGDDSFTLPLISIGGDGCISVVSNEIPKEFTQLVQAAKEGNYKKAQKLHYEWLDVMDVNFVEVNPQPVKTALSLMGKIEESFRLPLVPMMPENKKKLREILIRHKLVQ